MPRRNLQVDTNCIDPKPQRCPKLVVNPSLETSKLCWTLVEVRSFPHHSLPVSSRSHPNYYEQPSCALREIFS
eukprot:239024-Amphidinium_carterae.1